MSDSVYDGYLPRIPLESERLEMQHRLLVQASGYLLNPRIMEHITSSSRIADVATGTGAVLIDLSKEVPQSCVLDGLDISSQQFPPKDKLPENVTMQLYNVKQPPPAELIGKYDVVHLRYLNAALLLEDWPTVAQNVYQLVKPGGYIQWLEGDFIQALTWLRQDTAADVWVHKYVSDRVLPYFPDWAYPGNELKDILKRTGFEDVVQDVVSTDRCPDSRQGWTDVALGAMDFIFPNIESKKPDGLSSERCAEIMREFRKQSKGNLYPRFDLHVFMGRKPNTT